MPSGNSRSLILDLDEQGGNIVRCWAVAEALQNAGADSPIILSSNAGIHLTVQAGFHSEYFPGYTSNGFDYELWNGWLQLRILELCGAFDVGRIVYVGDRPPPGLLSAIDGLFHTDSVWVKREEPGPDWAGSDIAIRFDHLYEELGTPVISDVKPRANDMFTPIAPIFRPTRRVAKQSRSKQSRLPGDVPGKFVLLQTGLGNSPSSKQIHKFAHGLVEQSSGYELRTQTFDREDLLFVDDGSPGTEKRFLTVETLPHYSIVILENCDAASFCQVASAGVPAIIIGGDPLKKDRTANFVSREKLAVIHDPATELTPKKTKMLRQRIESVRNRLCGFSLANGADTLCRSFAKEG